MESTVVYVFVHISFLFLHLVFLEFKLEAQEGTGTTPCIQNWTALYCFYSNLQYCGLCEILDCVFTLNVH